MLQYNFVITWKKLAAAAMPGHLPLLHRGNDVRKDLRMKNFHRRLAAALLSAVLLATVLPTGVLAEEPEEVPQANAEPVCTCTIPCTEETKNAECAVCGADGAALEACTAANTSDTQTEEAVPVQEDTIVQLSVQDDVAYVDETGAVQTQDSVMEVTAEDTAWESGWYVAQGDVVIDHRVAVNGAGRPHSGRWLQFDCKRRHRCQRRKQLHRLWTGKRQRLLDRHRWRGSSRHWRC